MLDFKGYIKRIVSIILVIIMTLIAIPENTLIVYADSLSGDNNGGDTSSTGTSGTGSAWSTWRGNGYRIYLVDSNFNQVTSSLDFVNGQDKLAILKSNNNLMTLKDGRFASGATTLKQISYDDLSDWCGQPGIDMTQYLPVSATDGTQGRDFIEWFQGDWSGSVGVGNANDEHQSDSDSTPSSTPSNSSSHKKTPEPSSTPTIDSSLISSGHMAYVVGSAAYKVLDTSTEGKNNNCLCKSSR